MRTTTFTWDPGSGWSVPLESLDCRSDRGFVLAFAERDGGAQTALDQLHRALPDVTVVACSTAGQILGNRVDPAGLVAAATTFETAEVRSARVQMGAADPYDRGRELAASLSAAAGDLPIAGVMVFGGGLRLNGSALVAGLTAGLPPGTALSGGLAGDGPRFEHTWVHLNGSTSDDCAVALAVVGDSPRFRHGCQGGWDGFGPQRTITRSDGNVLYELDGQPALSLYKQYLGDRARELPSSALLFPLTVTSPQGTTRTVRTILAVDEIDQSMTFAGDVPTGWTARLMWTTTDGLTDGASVAGEESAQEQAGLAMAVSCVGRRLVLGARTEEELDSVVDAIGDCVPLIGFYSYGEIAPVGDPAMCALHNQTMTVTTISEAVAAHG